MAGRLELGSDESPFAALQRVIAAQALATAEQLTDRTVELSTRVHEARKRFKEMRALLRLFRGALGDGFTTENRWYRDAAREIAEFRDADAARAAVESLPKAIRRRFSFGTMYRLRRVVRNEHRAVYHDLDSVERRLEMIAGQLPVSAGRLSNLLLEGPDDFKRIEQAFVRTLRQGERLMHSASATHDPAEYHEWRKRVKEHWHHVQFLRPLRPRFLARREQLLDELSHVLGDYHDLQLIRTIVATAANTFSAGEAVHIDETLMGRQTQLERKAQALGRRIYKTAPKSLGKRLAKRWNRRRRRLQRQSSSLIFRRMRGESSHSRTAEPSARSRTP